MEELGEQLLGSLSNKAMFEMFMTEFDNISPLMTAVVEAQILDINGEYSRNRPIE